MKLDYTVVHIDTGVPFERSGEFVDKTHLLHLLNEWNRQYATKWHYFSNEIGMSNYMVYPYADPL